jgi:glycosyltransferase involved in cell wall biosynthesis
MKIAFASHTPIGDRFVVGSHHLARVFATMGHHVLHLAPPDSPLEFGMSGDFRWHSRWQAARCAPVKVDRRLYQLQGVSLLSIKSTLLLKSCAPALHLTVPSMERNITGLGFDSVDILFIDHPSWSGIWKWLNPRTIVYRPTDLYAECPLGYRFPSMGLGGRIRALESQVLSRSAMAICTSEPVAQHVREIARRRLPIKVVENGVDYSHFSQRQQLPDEYFDIPGPRAVYVGALDSRFDMPAVVSAARSLPEVRFVLIGPPPSGNHALPSNLHLLGPRDFAAVPGYLQHAQVGLLPFRATTANAGRSPMKYYEYLAAGLPIVASATAELKRRPNPFVQFYEHSDQLPIAIRQTLSLRADRSQISGLAEPFAWSARAATILNYVADVRRRSADLVGTANSQVLN